MTRPTQVPPGSRLNFRIRDCHPLRPTVPSGSANWSFCNFTIGGPTTPRRKTFTVWAVPLSLAATYGIDFSFFSTSYLDVSVHWVNHTHLCIQYVLIRESRDQHSFVNSPRLFADFHALHRLLIPRHPPCALSSLITKIQLSHSLTAHRSGFAYPESSMLAENRFATDASVPCMQDCPRMGHSGICNDCSKLISLSPDWRPVSYQQNHAHKFSRCAKIA